MKLLKKKGLRAAAEGREIKRESAYICRRKSREEDLE